MYDARIKQVALESGKSRPTVVKFFNFEKTKFSTAEKIYKACLQLIQSKVAERKSQAREMMRLSDELNRDR